MQAVTESPIKGAKGNVEFLALLTRATRRSGAEGGETAMGDGNE
jgi:hypothetical protein